MLTYPQVAKESFEFILLVAVIIRVEHTEEDALSETTRTDEEEITRLFLQLHQKHRLIYIIEILRHYCGKVRHTVWHLFYLLFHDALLFILITSAKIDKKFENRKGF